MDSSTSPGEPPSVPVAYIVLIVAVLAGLVFAWAAASVYLRRQTKRDNTFPANSELLAASGSFYLRLVAVVLMFSATALLLWQAWPGLYFKPMWALAGTFLLAMLAEGLAYLFRFNKTVADMGKQALTGAAWLFALFSRPLTHLLAPLMAQPVAEDESIFPGQPLLQGLEEFSHKTVRQVMQGRTDTVAFEVGISFQQLKDAIHTHQYSRVPIYRGHLDNIVGVLYVKDLLPYLHLEHFTWQRLIRKGTFVPETKKIDTLLQEFKARRVHLAVVTDEHGGTAGIVSLEDILEEIVGEIQDEFDEEEVQYSRLDEDTIVVDGRMPVRSMLRHLQMGDPAHQQDFEGGSNVSALIVHLLGRVPQPGAYLEQGGLGFWVEAVEKNRILRVKVARLARQQAS